MSPEIERREHITLASDRIAKEEENEKKRERRGEVKNDTFAASPGNDIEQRERFKLWLVVGGYQSSPFLSLSFSSFLEYISKIIFPTRRYTISRVWN